MKKALKALIMSMTIFAFSFTSLGGVYATTAFAAEAETTQQEVSSGNNVTNGFLALGLLTLLAKGHKSTNSSVSEQPSGSSGGNSTTQPAPSTVNGLTADEKTAIDLLNADRVKNGLPALKVNMNLVYLARNYSQDMINRGFFSHYNPEGLSPFDRMRNAGISYSYAGENIAINTSVSAAETAFMNSSGHRANILSPNFTEVGIGVVYKSNGSVYVTQEFIRP